MNDYISRQAALEILSSRNAAWDGYNKVMDMPAADVRENVKGEWIWISSTYDRTPCKMVYECNKCHHKTIVQSLGMDSPWEKFCPNCGARMRTEDTE